MNERAGIFDTAVDFDVSGFSPQKPRPAAPKEAVRKVAEGASFKSREAAAPEEPKAPNRSPRRYVTGRNVHLGMKVTRETYEAFYEIADEKGWILGETMERAVNALKKEISKEEGQG